MSQDDVRMFPNIVTPNNPVIFNEDVCNGCNNCVELCVMDILMPNPESELRHCPYSAVAHIGIPAIDDRQVICCIGHKRCNMIT